MNRKIMITFIISTLAGSLLLLYLMFSEYNKGLKLTMHAVTVALNEEVPAWSFVKNCSDEKATIHYVNPPDFTIPGVQEIQIEAVDADGGTCVKKALLNVSIIKSNLKLEASGQNVLLEDILAEGVDAEEVQFMEDAVILNHVGTFEIGLRYKGNVYQRTISVVDTIVPEVVLKEEVILSQGAEFDVLYGVESITDATDVTTGMKGMLDTDVVGEYPVILTFMDEGGNISEGTVKVKVVANMNETADFWGQESETLTEE